MDEAKLKQDLDKLISLRNEFMGKVLPKAVLKDEELKDKQGDEDANELIYEYRRLKAEVLLQLTSSREILQIADPVLRNDLKKFLVDGDELITFMKRKGFDKEVVRGFEKLLEPEFDFERLEDVAEDLFLSWFSHYDYVHRLLETATIVIKNIDLPEKLHSLINEVRQCVVFQNYLAAGIMLRTIAEVAVNDILEKNYEPLKDHDLSEKLAFLENKFRFSIPASILNKYRRDLNQFVHGERIMDRDKIYGYLTIVLNQIQELYEKSK